MNQFEAAEAGNLQWFIDQKAAGTLPSLLLRDSENQGAGLTSFDCAVKYGRLEVIKWIVSNSKDIFDPLEDNNWALWCAADNGHLGVVRWLVLDSGQPVGAKSLYSHSPDEVVESEHPEVANFLAKVVEVQNAVGLSRVAEVLSEIEKTVPVCKQHRRL